MFFPVIITLEEVPAIIDVEFGPEELFQIKSVVNIVVIEQDDVPEVQAPDSFFDIAGKTAVVKIIYKIKGFIGRQAVDGLNKSGRIELPHIVADGPKLFSITFYDLAMLTDARGLCPGKKGLPVHRQVYIQDPVVPGEMCCDGFTVAADLVIPGLQTDNNDVSPGYRTVGVVRMKLHILVSGSVLYFFNPPIRIGGTICLTTFLKVESIRDLLSSGRWRKMVLCSSMPFTISESGRPLV
jgi:hypothetical protein